MRPAGRGEDKMKKSTAIITTVLAIPVAAEAASRLIYHRSFMATAVDKLLKAMSPADDALNDPKAAADYFAKKDAENRKRYKIPSSVKFSVPVEEYDADGMQLFDINPGAQSDLIVIYTHGGAYIDAPMLPHFWFTNSIAKDLDAEVLFPIYPKVPCYDWKDCFDKMIPLYEHTAKANPDKRIVLMGDSAGGGLALALAQVIKEMPVKQPDRLVLISPWVDLSMENPEMKPYEPLDPMLGICNLAKVGEKWANGLDIKDPRLSPIYGNMEDLPPVDIFVGTREIFYPEMLRLDAALTKAGTDHTLTVGKELTHVYPLYPAPEGWQAKKKIEAIIR